MSATRYAIYYVPPKDSALAAFGNDWLGYDVENASRRDQPQLSGVDLAEITEEARRYGFHATMKAPFQLAEGSSEHDLLAQTAEFAARTAPARGPRLVLATIAGFLALVPDGPAPEIARLAGACVCGLDILRRPPDAAERARREAAGLSEGQRQNLARWGYPYVLEEFRFHMTLTRRLTAAEQAAIEPHLVARSAAVTQAPLVISDIALCRQEPGGAFTLWRRFLLAA